MTSYGFSMTEDHATLNTSQCKVASFLLLSFCLCFSYDPIPYGTYTHICMHVIVHQCCAFLYPLTPFVHVHIHTQSLSSSDIQAEMFGLVLCCFYV